MGDMMTPIHTESDIRPNAWQAHEQRNLDHAIQIVRRHTRIVRILRLAIPPAALASIVPLLIATSLNKANLPKLSAKIGIVGTKVRMEVPHIAGVTREGREYRVSADAAVQDIVKPKSAELSGIHAKFITKDRTR